MGMMSFENLTEENEENLAHLTQILLNPKFKKNKNKKTNIQIIF